MNNRSFSLPKGEYFFGDLGFVIKDRTEWDEIFCANDEGDWDYKDKDYLLFRTGGDGYFLNHRGNEDKEEFPVDSGGFGLIATDVLDPDTLANAIEESGFIFTAHYEVKIDVQADGDTYGVHVYPKREKYYFDDEAIFVVINEDEIDESYFVSRCPKFADTDKGKKLFTLEDDDTEEEQEDYALEKTALEVIKGTYDYEDLREISTLGCSPETARSHALPEQVIPFFDEYENEIRERLGEYLGSQFLVDIKEDAIDENAFKIACTWSFIETIAADEDFDDEEEE